MIAREAEQKAARIVEDAHDERARVKNEIVQLISRKETLIQQLRVVLSAELDLLKALELGTAEGLVTPSPVGTGKATIDLDAIAKTLDHDTAAQTH